MIAGIIALGLSLIALGFGLFGVIRGGRSTTVGPILLVLAGVCFTGAGLARNDCEFGAAGVQGASELRRRLLASQRARRSRRRRVPRAAVAPFVFARAFKSDSRWSELRRYSLLTGALTLALLLVFGVELFNGWNGLVQRVLTLVPLVWIAVIGAHLAEIAGAGPLFTPEEQRGTA